MSIKGNTVSTPTPRTNWNQTDPSKADYLIGKPDLEGLIQNAQQTATSAMTAANNALNSVTGAYTAAADAQTSANEAKTAANNAQTAANNANTAADNAQTSADNAQTVIDNHIADKNNPHKVTCEQIGAMSITQLWENAAWYSNYLTFVEQDIPLEWKKFDAVLIDHAESAMWTALRSTLAIAGSTETFILGNGSAWRAVTFTDTGLHFGKGQNNGNNDDYVIPYRIYGISFGGASSSTLPAAEGVSF